MWTLFPLFIAVSFVAGIALASVLWHREVKHTKKPGAGETASVPLQRNETLMTEKEKVLYQMIVYVMGKESLVLPKVSLGSLVNLPKGAERRDFYMGLVRSRVVDFVLCNPDTFAPALVIHVGDPADEDEDESQFIQQTLQTANMAVLWLDRKQSVSPQHLKDRIMQAVKNFAQTGDTDAGAGKAASKPAIASRTAANGVSKSSAAAKPA